jgi:hypothetical protein
MEKSSLEQPKKPKYIELLDYGSGISILAFNLKAWKDFSQIRQSLKDHPLPTVEEYMEIIKEKPHYQSFKKETEYNLQVTKRISEIAKEINALGEKDELQFKKLVNEFGELAYNKPHYFFQDI